MVSSVHMELMNVNFCWSVNVDVFMCRSPQENVAYKFIPICEFLLSSHAEYEIHVKLCLFKRFIKISLRRN